MIVHVLVLGVLLVPLDLRGLPFGRLEIRPARGFGAHAKRRQHPFEVGALAARAPRRAVMKDELLELVVAPATAILVERHDDCVRRDP